MPTKITYGNQLVSDISNSKVILQTTGKTLSGDLEILGEDPDFTLVTADPSDVVEGKTYYGASGELEEGEMPESEITPGPITPTKSGSTVYVTAGYVSNQTSVEVEPIPDRYQDVTPVTAVASDVKTGSQFVDPEGNVVEGTYIVPTVYDGEWEHAIPVLMFRVINALGQSFEFEFEQGMTWGDFVGSRYNIDNTFYLYSASNETILARNINPDTSVSWAIFGSRFIFANDPVREIDYTLVKYNY